MVFRQDFIQDGTTLRVECVSQLGKVIGHEARDAPCEAKSWPAHRRWRYRGVARSASWLATPPIAERRNCGVILGVAALIGSGSLPGSFELVWMTTGRMLTTTDMIRRARSLRKFHVRYSGLPDTDLHARSLPLDSLFGRRSLADQSIAQLASGQHQGPPQDGQDTPSGTDPRIRLARPCSR